MVTWEDLNAGCPEIGSFFTNTLWLTAEALP